MVCKELQYEDADEDQVVYRDQGINAEEYEKAMYGNFMKPKAKMTTRLNVQFPKKLMTV